MTDSPLSLVFETRIHVSWGHCDAAEIIYYPNYFEWFDECFHGLLGLVGMDQRTLRTRFGIIGTGAVNASGQFVSAVSYGDVLEARSYVEKWSERSFVVYHRFENQGQLAVEGREVRLWLTRTGEREGDIAASTIPDEFKNALGWRSN